MKVWNEMDSKEQEESFSWLLKLAPESKTFILSLWKQWKTRALTDRQVQHLNRLITEADFKRGVKVL